MTGSSEQDERTFMPSPLRLAEAHRRGQVAKSADLVAVATTLVVVVLLGMFAPRLMSEMTQMTAGLLDGGTAPTRLPGGAEVLAAVSPALLTLAPILVMAVLVAIVVNLVQIGFVATTETFRMDFGRLWPAQGTRRVFSLRSFVRLAMSVVKIVAVGAVAFYTFRDELGKMIASAALSTAGFAAAVGGCMYDLCLRVCGVLLALAVVDWLYQRWQHVQDLKMTRREWLDDMRRMEGDPKVKQRRRQLARQSVQNAGQGDAAVAGTQAANGVQAAHGDSRMNHGGRIDYIG